MQKIDGHIARLKQLRSKLEQEIDDYGREVQQVENDELGAMNRIKASVVRYMQVKSGTETVLGEAYAFKKNQEFNNARDYVDHLKQTAGHTRDAISKVDQIISNLEKTKSDLSYQLKEIDNWIDRADEVLN